MPDKSGYFGDQANTTGCKRPANGSSNGDAPMRPDLPDHIPTDQLTDQPTDQPSDQPALFMEIGGIGCDHLKVL